MGGCSASGIGTSAARRRRSPGSSPPSSMASLPSPTVTLTFTSVSLFSPWLRTWTSNERSSESGTVAEAPGTSATPSVTVPRPLPEPGRRALVAGAATGPSQAGDLIGHEVGIGPLDVGHELDSFCFGTLTSSARSSSRASARGWMKRYLSSTSLARTPASSRRCRRCSRGVPRPRGAQERIRDGSEAVPAQLQGVQQVLLRDRDLVGHVEVIRAVDGVADSLRRPFTTLAASTASSWSPEPPRSSNSWLPSSFD